MRTLNSRVGSAKRNRTDIASVGARPPGGRSSWPRTSTGELLDGRVRRILESIESGKTLTIHNLAVEFNLSPSYLQHLFKRETGVGMGEWLSETRLQRAARLLANGYMSVKEIAHGVGYEHVSSFIRAFERRFALTPARYRKRRNHAKC